MTAWVDGRASRREVLDWWDERFGIEPTVFEEYSFWEKGAGKVWIFNGEATDPSSEVEAIGMTFLRTRQDHWKPTGRAVSRFGAHATKNVIELDPEQAVTFAAGEDQGSPRVGWRLGIPDSDPRGRRGAGADRRGAVPLRRTSLGGAEGQPCGPTGRRMTSFPP